MTLKSQIVYSVPSPMSVLLGIGSLEVGARYLVRSEDWVPLFVLMWLQCSPGDHANPSTLRERRFWPPLIWTITFWLLNTVRSSGRGGRLTTTTPTDPYQWFTQWGLLASANEFCEA